MPGTLICLMQFEGVKMLNQEILKIWGMAAMLSVVAMAALASLATLLGCLIGVVWWMAQITRAFLASG